MGESRKNKCFGLLGKGIDYSFSRGYFREKFDKLGIGNCQYDNFDIPNIKEFPNIISQNADLKGLNVTIPYKEQVIAYLDALDEDANTIGAVNTIAVTSEGLKGYNTDCYGFEHSLLPHLKPHHTRALVLGTGGASKAVKFVLKKLGIAYQSASTSAKSNAIDYGSLDEQQMMDATIIINCTPLGTFPNVDAKPAILYKYLGSRHLLYDLVYNPPESAFLKEGKQRGAVVVNGHQMLVLQAERSWEIWSS